MVRFACGFFCFVFGVCFVLILTALQSQLQAPITVLFWAYFLPTSCWWFKLKIYRKCCSLKSSQTLDSKKMPFCKSMSFLITTFKVYCARETVSQQTETRKVTIQLCQSGGHQIPGNRYLDIMLWETHSKTHQKKIFHFWKGLFSPGSYWILSLMQLKRHVPCSVVRNSRPRARGLVRKHRAQGVWRGV